MMMIGQLVKNIGQKQVCSTNSLQKTVTKAMLSTTTSSATEKNLTKSKDNNGSLKGKVVYVSGGSRGIGLEIAKAAARDGAKVVIAAKTSTPHATLPGTVFTAVDELKALGGDVEALALVCDIRSEDEVNESIAKTVDTFGGIDILINCASAISLAGTEATTMKSFDLMNQINNRGTFLVSKTCIPHLRKSKNPHILNLSPPLNMNPVWFKKNLAYTLAKYGMSMQVFGMSGELKRDKIAVNALWPRTTVATSAVQNLLGGDALMKRSRIPEIMADAAYEIITSDSKLCTGNFFLDDDVLRVRGVEDFAKYKYDPELPESKLCPDFFL